MLEQQQGVERQDILAYIIEILTEITADWDVGEISSETQLGNLGLESISLVYLIGEVQHYYHLQDLLFEKLRTAGKKIADLRVTDVVDYVSDILTTLSVGPGGRRA
jgi:acyl carrier protein